MARRRARALCPPREGARARQDRDRASANRRGTLADDVQSRRLAHLAGTLEHVTWLHTELGIPLPALDDDPLALAVFAPELGLTTRPADPFAARHCARVFAQYVARLEEAANESLALDGDTLGVEGVEPAPALLAWAERLKADVRAPSSWVVCVY